MGSSNCDTCAYNVYDEDDMVRVMERQYKECPFYRNGDEYAVVRKQI